MIKGFFIVFFIFAISFNAVAQGVLSNDPAQRIRAEETEKLRQKAIEKKFSDYKEKQEEKKKQEKEKSSDVQKKIKINKINFQKSALVSEQQQQEFAKKILNKQISSQELQDFLSEYNKVFYIDKNYIASQAYFPKQDLTGGTLQINTFEAKIDEINILNNEKTKENYVRHTSEIDELKDKHLNTKEIEKKVLRYNASTDAKAQVSLKPSKEYGKTDIDFVINEPKKYSLSLFTDNYGQRDTGEERYGAYSVIRNLTGYRDVLNIGAVFSEGSEALFASYEGPVMISNIRAGLGFDYSDTEIVNGILTPLDVNGESTNFYIYGKKPIWTTEKITANAMLTFSMKESNSYLSDVLLLDAKTNDIALGLDGLYLFEKGYWYNQLSFKKALTVLDGDYDFIAINYNTQLKYNLYGDFWGDVKFAGQFDNDTDMASSSKIQIGGINSVRGYPEGFLVGEDGFALNLELSYDANKWDNKYISNIDFFAFFDYGMIWEMQTLDTYNSDIYSIGGGARFQIYNKLDANLTFAKGLVDHEYLSESPGVEFLFSVQLNF